MNQAPIKRFLEEDFAEALTYYDEGAKKAKLTFRILSVYSILVSTGLTLVVTLGPQTDSWRWLGGIMSASMSIATALLAYSKCQETWLSYRTSWDALERERRLYETGAGEYRNTSDRDARFVERVEAIRSNEAMDFYARYRKHEDQTKKPE